MFRGDVLVLKLFRFLEGAFQNLIYSIAHVLLPKALHFRQACDGALNFLRHHLGPNSQLRDQRRHHAAVLRHQRRQQMYRLDLLVLARSGNFLRALHRLLSLQS